MTLTAFQLLCPNDVRGMVHHTLGHVSTWFSYNPDPSFREILFDGSRNKWGYVIEIFLLLFRDHGEATTNIE
jgi:hypothetical protein